MMPQLNRPRNKKNRYWCSTHGVDGAGEKLDESAFSNTQKSSKIKNDKRRCKDCLNKERPVGFCFTPVANTNTNRGRKELARENAQEEPPTKRPVLAPKIGTQAALPEITGELVIKPAAPAALPPKLPTDLTVPARAPTSHWKSATITTNDNAHPEFPPLPTVGARVTPADKGESPTNHKQLVVDTNALKATKHDVTTRQGVPKTSTVDAIEEEEDNFLGGGDDDSDNGEEMLDETDMPADSNNNVSSRDGDVQWVSRLCQHPCEMYYRTSPPGGYAKNPVVEKTCDMEGLNETNQAKLEKLWNKANGAKSKPIKAYPPALRGLKNAKEKDAVMVTVHGGIARLKVDADNEEGWIVEYFFIKKQTGKFYVSLETYPLSQTMLEALFSDWALRVAKEWKDSGPGRSPFMIVDALQFWRSWVERELTYVSALPREDGSLVAKTLCGFVRNFDTRELFYKDAEWATNQPSPPKDILDPLFDRELTQKRPLFVQFPAGASSSKPTSNDELEYTTTKIQNRARLEKWDCLIQGPAESISQMMATKDPYITYQNSVEENLAKFREDCKVLASTGNISVDTVTRKLGERMKLQFLSSKKMLKVFNPLKPFTDSKHVMALVTTKTTATDPKHCVCFIRTKHEWMIDPSEEYVLKNTEGNLKGEIESVHVFGELPKRRR